jgi:phosphoribosylglycinamide formyltransferase-1
VVRTAVLVSGGGANLQAILDARCFGELPDMDLAAVISSATGVFALERAENAGVPVYLVERDLFPNSASFSNALLAKLRDLDIELVVCAGFQEKLSYGLLHYYRYRVINVQPALFPAFCGESFDPVAAVEGTISGGVRITGATAYLMGEEDTGFGPIITQQAVRVQPDDTPASLSDRIMRRAEWPVLVEAVMLFCAGRLHVENGSVQILPERPGPAE